MTAYPCKQQFPPNPSLSLAKADYLSKYLRIWGVDAALSSDKIAPWLDKPGIIAFYIRNMVPSVDQKTRA
jgi:hypothetical protein